MTSFADRDGFIWFDGELKPWRECTTHVLTYSLHYGVGCFEGVRAYQTPGGTAIFRLEEHTRRLMNSAKIIGMAMPFTAGQLNEAQKDVLRANKLDSAYLRKAWACGQPASKPTSSSLPGSGAPTSGSRTWSAAFA